MAVITSPEKYKRVGFIKSYPTNPPIYMTKAGNFFVMKDGKGFRFNIVENFDKIQLMDKDEHMVDFSSLGVQGTMTLIDQKDYFIPYIPSYGNSTISNYSSMCQNSGSTMKDDNWLYPTGSTITRSSASLYGSSGYDARHFVTGTGQIQRYEKNEVTIMKAEKPKGIFQLIKLFIKKLFHSEEVKQQKLIESYEYNEDKTRRELIGKSEFRLRKLSYYYDTYKLDLLKDIFDYTRMAHEAIITNNLKPQLLEQFHIYYTDNFIILFDKIIENNKLRKSMIDKRKIKLQSDIKKLNQDKIKENNVVKDIDKIKNDVIKYNELVKKHILNDVDQKVCEEATSKDDLKKKSNPGTGLLDIKSKEKEKGILDGRLDKYTSSKLKSDDIYDIYNDMKKNSHYFDQKTADGIVRIQNRVKERQELDKSLWEDERKRRESDRLLVEKIKEDVRKDIEKIKEDVRKDMELRKIDLLKMKADLERRSI